MTRRSRNCLRNRPENISPNDCLKKRRKWLAALRFDRPQSWSETAQPCPPELLLKGLSRRTLLKTGLVGFVLVSAGSAALLLQKPKPRAAGSALSVLSDDEASVLSALADRLCPALGQGAPGARAVDLVGNVDKLLASANEEAQKGVKMGLMLFESAFTGALFGERVRPFSQLSGEQQDVVIRSWQHAGVGFRRTVMRALSALVMTVYWGDPRSWGRIGYVGPPSPAGLRASYADNLMDLASLGARAAKET